MTNVYECQECGSVVNTKVKWPDCGNGHKAVGMTMVLDWGGYKRPDVVAVVDQQTLAVR